MTRFWTVLLVAITSVLTCIPLVAADSPWQYGRISDVSKSVITKTKAWVVNTPITEDEISYTISVHLQDKIIIGSYELTREESGPPEEWPTNYPVMAQLLRGRIHLWSATGDWRLPGVGRKMRWTAAQ